MLNYDQVLSGLQAVYNGNGNADVDGGNADGNTSGHCPKKERKEKKKERKERKERKEDKKRKRQPDLADQEGHRRESANSTATTTTHVGRYKRRGQIGKKVSMYSAIDMAAILGMPVDKAAAETDDIAGTPLKPEDSDGGTRPTRGRSKDRKKEKKQKEKQREEKEEKKKRKKKKDEDGEEGVDAPSKGKDRAKGKILLPPSEREDNAAEEDCTEPPSEYLDEKWWGFKLFIYGGRLGSERRRERVAGEDERGFSFDDQEKLYNDAKDAKSSGRKGLGKSSKKAAGADWKGKKVTLDTDD